MRTLGFVGKFATLAGVGLLMVLCGCWTFNESEFPRTQMTPAQGAATNLTISVVGFDAVLTEYEAVYGFSTVYVPDYYAHHHYYPYAGHYETVPTETLVPMQRATDMFISRARDALEESGFTLAVGNADRLVEVRFSGPHVDNNDRLAALGWEVGTIFWCDYAAAEWTAKLRIRDGRTGKLLFSHDYNQRFETHVVGLLPLLCASTSQHLKSTFIQTWCLAALTDRALSDTTAFLNK